MFYIPTLSPAGEKIMDNLSKYQWKGDLVPFEHSEEGTHYACEEMLKQYIVCCHCNAHDCKLKQFPEQKMYKLYKEKGV